MSHRLTPEPKINLQQHASFSSVRPSQPRAVGEGAFVVAGGEGRRTHLQALRQAGSTKLVFPQSYTSKLEAIVVNTAGGITGGDTFSLAATAKSGADLTITTQAAERAYRAQEGEIGTVHTKLSIATGACLNWLPQELILFENCALQRKLDVDLQPGARFLMVEPVVFGRKTMGETLRHISFRDRIRVTRDGQPLYLDGMNITGDAAAHMARAAIGNGAGAMASLVLVASDASSQISTIRKMLPPTAGASMIANDVLVVRQLATDSFALRRALIPVLDHLTNNSLPISWRL